MPDQTAMTSSEVNAIVLAEIAGDWSRSNAHGVDLRSCLVTPRKVSCHNSFPELNRGKPLDLWIVLEEKPGAFEGYVIIFDEAEQLFGLASWNDHTPTLFGFYGTFLDTLASM